MPSKSKAQQRFFGMVDAYKKGEMKNPSSKIKKAAKGMSMSDVKDFAETKHKGLPEKVEEGKVILRMTENEFKKMVNESVNKILTELDWKTYMNAARKRKQQADDMRNNLAKEFPNSMIATKRNGLDDKSDALETHAQKTFQKQHGKFGHDHWYENDTPDFKGRYSLGYMATDNDFDSHAPIESGWWDGEKANGIRRYRYGNGYPFRNNGYIHDDTFDYAWGDGWNGDKQSHRTERVDADGRHFEADVSTDPDYFHISKQQNYNDALDDMATDMHDYYSGKSKYIKGNGWENR